MLRLSAGTEPVHAAAALRDRALEVRNLLATTSDVVTLRLRYAAWVSTVERQLRTLFADPETWVELRSQNYWSICDKNAYHLRLEELIRDEVEVQAARIERLAERLERFPVHLLTPRGRVAVLDTNVLLHFLPPAQVKWEDVVGDSPVRLVIPLRVIEELDEKKYSGRANLADRSRRLLSQLRVQLADAAGSIDVGETTTLEVLLDDEPRVRTQDADQEILDTCEYLQMVGAPVVLVTGDLGLTIRAVGRGIEVREMPQRYLR